MHHRLMKHTRFLLPMLTFAIVSGGLSQTTNLPALIDLKSPRTASTNAEPSRIVKRDDIVRLMALTRVEEHIKAIMPLLLNEWKRSMPDVSDAEWRKIE